MYVEIHDFVILDQTGPVEKQKHLLDACYISCENVAPFSVIVSLGSVLCFFGFGASNSGPVAVSAMRVRFLVPFLRAFVGTSRPGGPIAPAMTLSSANNGFPRLILGLKSSSLRSISGDDKAEESESFSFRAKEADVETDPLAESGALEDVGDRMEAIEARGDPTVPL